MLTNHNGSRRDMFSLAGWLFADLLLGLAVLFMAMGAGAAGDAPTGPPPTETATPTLIPTFTPLPTYTPLPTLVPLPTYTPFPTPPPVARIGLDQSPVFVWILPGQSLVERMDSELRAYPGRQAGFVITFGYNRDLQLGVDMAKAANKQIKASFPQVFPAEMPTRDLAWIPDGSGVQGTLKFEIFFIRQIVSPD